MATNLSSSEVSTGQDADASQYNNLRTDVVVNAGDYETAGGDGDTITLAIDSAISAYAAGQRFRFQANAANSGPATLNVNSIGAKTIKKNYNQDLALNDIRNGQEVEVVYDGTNMQLVSPSSSGAARQFGGDGSDGALSVTSGTTNIDASSANVVVKNYTSLSISAGATLALTNKASTGTLLILKVQGDVTIEGTIDLDGDGADAETNGFSILDIDADHEGGTGANGAGGAGGAAGTVGAILGDKRFYITPDENRLYRKFLVVACGSGGGNGGMPEASHGSYGAGGAGGGALIIECAGSLDFDAGGVISVNGTDGGDGSDYANSDDGAPGGGGGGSTGMVLILYNSLTDNSGTINTKGGAGGDGGDVTVGGGSTNKGGGGGGAGAGSYTEAGKAGGAGGGSSQNGNAGTATNSASGAGGGGGAGAPNGGPARTGGAGGAQGAADSNHYLVAENKNYF